MASTPPRPARVGGADRLPVPRLARTQGKLATTTHRILRLVDAEIERLARVRIADEQARVMAGLEPYDDSHPVVLPDRNHLGWYSEASRATIAMTQAQLSRDQLMLARQRLERGLPPAKGDPQLPDAELVADVACTMTDDEWEIVLARRAKSARAK